MRPFILHYTGAPGCGPAPLLTPAPSDPRAPAASRVQVLSTRQIAGFMMAFQPHVIDPEQACKLLLEGSGGARGGDSGHLVMMGATPSTSS